VTPVPSPPTLAQIDLMAALRRSVEEAKADREVCPLCGCRRRDHNDPRQQIGGCNRCGNCPDWPDASPVDFEITERER
jgi:hypothetical protein